MNTYPIKQEMIQKLRSLFDVSPPFVKPSSFSPIKHHQKTALYKRSIKTTATAYLKTTKGTGFAALGKKNFKFLFFCIYSIQSNQENEPFLQYLLYKYSQKEKDVCIFPFIKKIGKISIKKELDNIMIKKLKRDKLLWNYKGYIESNKHLFLFIKLQSKRGKFSKRRNEKNRTDHLWWCLLDEICNQKKILNFPIHKIVTNLFLHNPILIYLRDTYGINKPIPRALYYGNSALMIPFNFVFGPKPENINANYGPYYYLGSYRKAIRYGGWTGDYKPTNNEKITDKNGKWVQGGVVRYAVFLGDNLKVILNHPHDANTEMQDNTQLFHLLPFKTRLVDPKGTWVKNYTSLYYGRAKIPEIKNGIWRALPGFVTKEFNQQIPLTFHTIDSKTLKVNWDPEYTKYYIK